MGIRRTSLDKIRISTWNFEAESERPEPYSLKLMSMSLLMLESLRLRKNRESIYKLNTVKANARNTTGASITLERSESGLTMTWKTFHTQSISL
mmetsp:Transcript_32596/g.56577  ORF Transcript_32596/g.56577 Transcript_32596/m.56577 type:complete len:94 (-) Transcript_32596:4334-4615(-)